MKKLLSCLALMVILLSCATTAPDKKPTPQPPAAPVIDAPVENASWSLQYNGDLVERDVTYCVFDLFNYSEDQIKALKCEPIAYFSLHYESFRPDKDKFKRSCLDGALGDWEGEKVIKNSEHCINHTFENVIKPRIDLALKKGFKKIDPDNLDQSKKKYGLMYFKLVSNYARSKGLKVGQKNAYSWRFDLKDFTDWYMVEQCAQYDICKGFDEMGKPWFNIEYYDWTCKKANKEKIVYTIKKKKSGYMSMASERELCYP